MRPCVDASSMHLHRSGRSLASIVQAAVRWAPLQTPIPEPLCHAQVSLSTITILLPRIRLTCPLVAPQNHPHRPLECVCPAHCRPPPPSLSNKLTSPLLPLRPISQNSLPHPTPPVTLRPTTRVSLSPSRSSCPSPACTRAMSDRPRLLTEQRASTGVRNQSSPQLSFPSLFSWEEEGELEIDFSPSRVFVADETLSSRLLLRVRELRRPPEVHVSEEHMKYVLSSCCCSWVRCAVLRTDGLIHCWVTLPFSIVINDLRPVTVDSLVYDFEASENL